MFSKELKKKPVRSTFDKKEGDNDTEELYWVARYSVPPTKDISYSKEISETPYISSDGSKYINIHAGEKKHWFNVKYINDSWRIQSGNAAGYMPPIRYDGRGWVRNDKIGLPGGGGSIISEPSKYNLTVLSEEENNGIHKVIYKSRSADVPSHLWLDLQEEGAFIIERENYKKLQSNEEIKEVLPGVIFNGDPDYVVPSVHGGADKLHAYWSEYIHNIHSEFKLEESGVRFDVLNKRKIDYGKIRYSDLRRLPNEFVEAIVVNEKVRGNALKGLKLISRNFDDVAILKEITIIVDGNGYVKLIDYDGEGADRIRSRKSSLIARKKGLDTLIDNIESHSKMNDS